MQPDRLLAENRRLQRCISDLAGLMALPATWQGHGPAEIAHSLLDSVLGLLDLDVAHLHSKDAEVEATRLSPWASSLAPEGFEASLAPWLGGDAQDGPQRLAIGGHGLAALPLRLGLLGEIGTLVAGSRRADFPSQAERLLLGVAANQATIGLQAARPLSDRRDEEGRSLKRHGNCVDMQNWKQAQDELRETQTELARVGQIMTLGQLTASIAHELNQPLAGIMTNAGTGLRMLTAEPPNIDGARETARRTIRDARRASEVITRLRGLFTRRATASDIVNLNTAAQEVIALSSNELQRSGVGCRIHLAENLPCVMGDRVQLQQVILNFILNGAEAMSGVVDRPRELVLSTEREGTGHVRVAVRDAGIGFDPALAEKLFSPFYTTKSDGMGIGLSVSRTIVENHRGRLWGERNDGPGSTFCFTIPTRPAGA